MKTLERVPIHSGEVLCRNGEFRVYWKPADRENLGLMRFLLANGVNVPEAIKLKDKVYVRWHGQSLNNENLIRELQGDRSLLDRMMRLLEEEVRKLHLLGYIHRDLFPQNITWDGEMVWLIDFGMAQPISPEAIKEELANLENIAYQIEHHVPN